MPEFTKTQTILVDILKDGRPHHRDELLQALDPEGLTEASSLMVMMTSVRKKLRPQGLDILGQFIRRRYHYRMVRTLENDE